MSINTIFAASTTQLTNLLNATGRIKTTFKLMIMWTVLTWLFIPFLSMKYSVIGAAMGYAIVGTSSIVAIIIVYKIINFSLYKSIFVPAIASVIMGLVLFVVRRFLSVSITSVWLIFLLGGITYMTSMYFLVGSSIFYDAKKGVKAVFSRG